MSINLNQKTYPRLGYGVHQVKVISWELKHSDKADEDFISIYFAPAAEPENIYNKVVMESYVTTFTRVLQSSVNKPGLAIDKLLDHCMKNAFPATFESKVSDTDGKTYDNWYLGQAALTPAAVAPVKSDAKAAAVQRRPA